MLGFELDLWDYLTFATVAVAGVAGVVILLWIAGLPGHIAIARKHPEAEAVNIMGYAGFLAVVPWIQAFIWAFKPTNVIDIRRFPREEAKAIEEENARLRGVDSGESRAKQPDAAEAEPEAPTVADANG